MKQTGLRTFLGDALLVAGVVGAWVVAIAVVTVVFTVSIWLGVGLVLVVFWVAREWPDRDPVKRRS